MSKNGIKESAKLVPLRSSPFTLRHDLKYVAYVRHFIRLQKLCKIEADDVIKMTSRAPDSWSQFCLFTN